MPNLQTITDALLGPRADAWVARATVWTALIGFLAHLSLWALLASGFWSFGRENVLLQSPLLALYTPFSILLAYEVFQLIRVIPESFSASIGKQFEVITLAHLHEQPERWLKWGRQGHSFVKVEGLKESILWRTKHRTLFKGLRGALGIYFFPSRALLRSDQVGVLKKCCSRGAGSSIRCCCNKVLL